MSAIPQAHMHGVAMDPPPRGRTPGKQDNPNITRAHPGMPFIPKYSIVPDAHKIKWGNKSK